MRIKLLKKVWMIGVLTLCACNYTPKQAYTPPLYKGVYTSGPNAMSFKDCDGGKEFWVYDSSGELEKQYSALNFQKPYIPVYVEVEGEKIKSGNDGLCRDFDSTLVVKKIITITKQIPQECN